MNSNDLPGCCKRRVALHFRQQCLAKRILLKTKNFANDIRPRQALLCLPPSRLVVDTRQSETKVLQPPPTSS